MKKLPKARRKLVDIIKGYPLAVSKLWEPYCHRWDGLGQDSKRNRGCGHKMQMVSLGVYKCPKCDIEEKRTSQREAGIRFFRAEEAFLCTGGNRAGKTQFGAQLAIAIGAGRDEWWVREWIKLNNLPEDIIQRKPQTVWYAALSYGDALEYGRPKLEQYAPQGTKYTRWRAQDRASMRLPNGGRIVSLSVDAGREKFQGASVKFIWCDEEPSSEVFEECLLRTVDTQGTVLITATPLKGLSFMYDFFVDSPPSGFERYAISGLDNPYISSGKLRRAVSHLSEASQNARLFGMFTSQSGLVYPEFDRAIHTCKPFEIPKHWKRDLAIDFGVRNPFCCLWIAHDEDKDILYVYREYFKTEKTTLENGRMIIALGAKDPDLRWIVADPESKDGRLLLSRELGLHTKPAPKHIGVMETINQVKDRLKVIDGVSGLVVFNNCKELIKEFRKYKWSKSKGKDKPEKQWDHGLDALRYEIAFLYRFRKHRR
jgi:phage terminase large subunit-like protein